MSDSKPVSPKFAFRIPNNSTSGSSFLAPEYSSSVYENAHNFKTIFGDREKSFLDEIQPLYIAEMKKQADRDDETYKLQKCYGKMTFITATTLVIVGIVFSLLQLINALRIGNYDQLNSVVEIEQAGKIVMSTSLVGGFVLVVSLLFYVLFLKYVYSPNTKITSFFENVAKSREILDNLN